MNCPVCKVPLVISERQGVEIDYCPQCRGVWLDRGELDKILDRAATTDLRRPDDYRREEIRREDSRRPPQVQIPDPRYHGQQPYHRKKGGFLDDLFDFD